MHADEYVLEIVDGVDAVFLACGDERVEHGEIVPGVLAADDAEVLPSERHAPQAGLCDVVVGRDSGVAEEAAELAEVSKQVADRFAHSAARLEGPALMMGPPQEQSEERSRPRSPQFEVRGGADDAGELRVALDLVDLVDDVENNLDLGVLALVEELATGLSEAAGAGPLSGLGDGVVADVRVYDEPALRGPAALRTLARVFRHRDRDDLRDELLVPPRCGLSPLVLRLRRVGLGDERGREPAALAPSLLWPATRRSSSAILAVSASSWACCALA